MTMTAKIEAMTREFDVQNYLDSEADCLAFVHAAFDESEADPAFLCVALGEVAKSKGMTRIAKLSGLTREGLYKSLSAEGNPSFATVQKVLRSLGMQLVPKLISAEQFEHRVA